MHTKLLGIISVGLDITDQLLIRFVFVFIRLWRKKKMGASEHFRLLSKT
jgi:hypothetical protein